MYAYFNSAIEDPIKDAGPIQINFTADPVAQLDRGSEIT